MKKIMPIAMMATGIGLCVISQVLRMGQEVVDTAVTNVTSSFMLIAGCICLLGGLVTYFLKGDDDVW